MPASDRDRHPIPAAAAGRAERPSLSAIQIGRTLRERLLDPGRALLAISVLLPATLFALAAVYNYGEAVDEAYSRVSRTARILQEHAVKVFETHRLAIEIVNERLRSIDPSSPAGQAAEHDLLKRLQDELDQIATITVTDAEGRMQGSSRTYPPDPSVSFADRDWFRALKQTSGRTLYVSRSYTGRQSGQAVFNVAGRVFSPTGAFAGAIAISVDRAYFERFYRTVEPEFDDSVILAREDGQVLARDPPSLEVALPPRSVFLARIRASPSGSYRARSAVDGVERILAFCKIGDYPVYVGFGISVDSALAHWRRNLVVYALVAVFAALVLLAVSWLAIRNARRERMATLGWQDAAAALKREAAERGRVEDQLRQSQKMEAVGRLTGGVAHDFNNLLTVVIGSLDLLRRRMADGDARLLRLVTNAIDGANRAASLTHRLLAFSRQQPLDPKPLDANRLVAGMSDLFNRTLGEQIAIETVLAAGLWPTFADPNQLESALLNLAVNARDAMPEGGKLTVETANAYLDERYAAQRPDVQPGQYVMIAVCDSGTGMAPEVVAQAFEPFFTTKPIGKGTGLGLSQVYGFAKQSGGHAALYSEPDHGTTIKLYLPRLRQSDAVQEDATAQADRTPLARSRGETVLVVEDENLVRQFSVAALSEAGYRVLEAADGPEGLAQIRAEPEIGLLFTDVVLAGPLNGRKLADEAAKIRPGLPVLFTTGYTRNAIIHHGRLDEGVNFVGKPFTAPELLAKVRQVIDLAHPVVEPDTPEA